MGLLRMGLAIALMIAVCVIVGCGGSDSLQPAALDAPEAANIVRVGEGPARVSVAVAGWPPSRVNLGNYVSRVELTIQHATAGHTYGPYSLSPTEPKIRIEGLLVGETMFEARAYARVNDLVIGKKDLSVTLTEGDQKVQIDMEPVTANLAEIGITFPELPDPGLIEDRPALVTEPLGLTTGLEIVSLNGRTDIDPHSVFVTPKMEDRFHKLSLQDMTTLVHWQFSVLEYGYPEREYQILQCRGPMVEGREYVLWGWPYILPNQSNDFMELARFTVGDGHEYGCRVLRRMYAEGYSKMMPMGNEFGVSHNEYSLGYAFLRIRGQVEARVFDAFAEREIPNLRPPELRYDTGFEATGFSPLLEPGRKYRVETNDSEIGTYEFWTLSTEGDWKDPFYPPWWVSWPSSQTIDWKQSVVEAVGDKTVGVADGKDIVTIHAAVRGYDGQILSADKISEAVCFNSAEEFYREQIEGPIVVEEGKAVFEWKISTELNGRDAYFIQVTGSDDRTNRGKPFQTTLGVVIVDWQRP